MDERQEVNNYLQTQLGRTPSEDEQSKFFDLYMSNKRGLGGDLIDRLKSGAFSTGANLSAAVGNTDLAADLAQKTIDAQQQDPLLTQRVQQLSNPDSAVATAMNVAKDPKATLALIAETLPASLGMAASALPVGRAGSVISKKLGKEVSDRLISSGAFGGISGFNEYGASLLSGLAENGVNITNAEELSYFLNDPEVAPILREDAIERGIPVGVFDGLALSLTGKFMTKGSGLKGAAKEIGVQAGAGAAGEAGAQILDEGEITDRGGITLEGLLEVITAAPAAIAQPTVEKLLRGEYKDLNKVKENAESLATIEDISDETASPYIDENGAVVEDDIPSSKPAEVKKAEAAKRKQIKSELPPEVIKADKPRRMRSRLARLSKSELIEDRAKNYAGIPEKELLNDKGEYLTKRQIIDKIFEKYKIDDTKPEDQQSATPFVIEEKETGTETNPNFEGVTPPTDLNQKTRNELYKIATAKKPKSPRTQGAAIAWLAKLPDNSKLASKVKTMSRGSKSGKEPELKGNVLESLNRDLKKLASKRTKDETKESSVGGVVSNLLGTNFFSNKETETIVGNNLPELESYIKGTGTTYEGGIESIKDNAPLKQLAIRKAITDHVTGTQPLVYKRTPNLYNAAERVKKLSNDFDKDSNNVDQIEPEKSADAKVAKNNEELKRHSDFESMRMAERLKDESNLPKQLWNPTTYGLDSEQIAKSTITTPFKSMLRTSDIFNSMFAFAEKVPAFAPIFNIYQERSAMMESSFRENVQDLSNIIDKYGVNRVDEALKVMEVLTHPKFKKNPQTLQFNESGQLIFKGLDGRTKRLDLTTSNVIKDIDMVFKNKILQSVQALRSNIQAVYKIPVANKEVGLQKSDIETEINESLALGDDKRARELEGFLDQFNTLDKLYRSKTAYLPHSRSRGPFGLTVYDKDGELVGFYSIKSNKFGQLDTEDLQKVRERIKSDQAESGETFYNIDGGAVENAKPFKKTQNTYEKYIMKNATDPSIAYAAFADLLANKGIDQKTVEEVFEKYQFGSNLEKFMVNYRTKQNYYGYDKDDMLDNIVQSMNTQSAVTTQFLFKDPLNKSFADVSVGLGLEEGGSSKTLKQLGEFRDYMESPSSFADRIRSFTFWWFLAGNPSTALLQLVTPLIISTGYFSQFAGLTGFAKMNAKLPLYFKKAYDIQRAKAAGLLNRKSLDEFSKRTGVSVKDARALLEAYQGGQLDPGFAIEAFGYSRSKDARQKELRKDQMNPAEKGFTMAKTGAEKMIQVGEDVGRLTTWLIGNDILSDPKAMGTAGRNLYKNSPNFKSMVDGSYGGKINKSAVLRHALKETHAIFGKEGRAPILRSAPGAALFAFMQYPISIFELYLRLLSSRGLEGKKAAMQMAVVYPVLFGGLVATPGFETLDWLSQWYQRMDNNPTGPKPLEILLRDGMGKALEDMGYNDTAMVRQLITKGPFLDGLLGIDASQRVRVDYPWQPFLSVLANPSDSPFAAARAAEDMLGPVGQLLVKFPKVLSSTESGQSSLGEALVDNVAPVPIRNVKKASDIATGDYRTSTGKRIATSFEEDPSLWDGKQSALVGDIFRQGIGFRPSRLSQASSIGFYENAEQMADAQATAKFNSKIAKSSMELREAYNSGDEKAYDKAKKEHIKNFDELIDWNFNEAKNPKTINELMKSLQTQVKKRTIEEANPYMQRSNIARRSNRAEDARRLGLPALEDVVYNRP